MAVHRNCRLFMLVTSKYPYLLNLLVRIKLGHNMEKLGDRHAGNLEKSGSWKRGSEKCWEI